MDSFHVQPCVDACKNEEAGGVPELQYAGMPARCTYTDHTFSMG